jgi:hypothetical protein
VRLFRLTPGERTLAHAIATGLRIVVLVRQQKYDHGSLVTERGGLVIAHHARIAAVVVATAVVAIFGAGAATGARAAGTAAVCKTFTTSGLKPQWSVIGNVTCAQAQPWLVKLLADHGKPGVKVVLTNTPKGFKCTAVDDAKGRPAVGSCYTGTIKFPNNGFQWLA